MTKKQTLLSVKACNVVAGDEVSVGGSQRVIGSVKTLNTKDLTSLFFQSGERLVVPTNSSIKVMREVTEEFVAAEELCIGDTIEICQNSTYTVMHLHVNRDGSAGIIVKRDNDGKAYGFCIPENSEVKRLS